MGIKDVFGKVVGFFGGVVPAVMQLGEAANMVLKLIKVGVAQRDRGKLLLACDSMNGIAVGLRALADEFDDVANVTREALSDSSPGGADLTGVELKQIGGEVDDIPPKVAAISQDAAHLISAIKATL